MRILCLPHAQGRGRGRYPLPHSLAYLSYKLSFTLTGSLLYPYSIHTLPNPSPHSLKGRYTVLVCKQKQRAKHIMFTLVQRKTKT